MPPDTAACHLPRVLIDGTGDVWVRDWQEGLDHYTLHPDPEQTATFDEIDRQWGISSFLMSGKSVPS